MRVNESTSVSVSVKKKRNKKKEWPKKSKRVLFVYAECSHKMGSQVGASKYQVQQRMLVSEEAPLQYLTEGCSYTNDEKRNGGKSAKPPQGRWMKK